MFRKRRTVYQKADTHGTYGTSSPCGRGLNEWLSAVNSLQLAAAAVNAAAKERPIKQNTKLHHFKETAKTNRHSLLHNMWRMTRWMTYLTAWPSDYKTICVQNPRQQRTRIVAGLSSIDQIRPALVSNSGSPVFCVSRNAILCDTKLYSLYWSWPNC